MFNQVAKLALVREGIFIAANADELHFILKIQVNCDGFNVAAFKNRLCDFFTGSRSAVAQNFFDYVGDGAGFVTPIAVRVNSSSD